MASHTVVVDVEQVDLDTGLWCTPCALSTGVRIWFTTTIANRTSLRSTAVGIDCGGSNVADA